jgi:hypothetical protein
VTDFRLGNFVFRDGVVRHLHGVVSISVRSFNLFFDER